jgi:hypothetical protein
MKVTLVSALRAGSVNKAFDTRRPLTRHGQPTHFGKIARRIKHLVNQLRRSTEHLNERALVDRQRPHTSYDYLILIFHWHRAPESNQRQPSIHGELLQLHLKAVFPFRRFFFDSGKVSQKGFIWAISGQF